MAFLNPIINHFKVILFIFCFSTVSAQSEIEADSLLATASELLYSNPKLSEKIARLVFENKNNDADKKSEALFILSQVDYFNANYESSLSNLYNIESLNENASEKASRSIKVDFFLSRIYRDLQILDLAEKHFIKANKAFAEIPKPAEQVSVIHNYENGLYQAQKKNFKRSDSFFRKSLEKSPDRSSSRYLNYLGLGYNFINEKKQDSAAFYFSKIPKESHILFAKSNLGLAEIPLSKFDWKTAEQLLIVDYKPDVLTQKQRYTMLSLGYLDSGNIEQHEFYKIKSDSLEVKITQNQNLAENFVIKHIEEQENSAESNADSFWKNSVFIIIGLIILLLIPIIYYYFKTKSDYKKYLDVINDINTHQTKSVDEDIKEKQILIPEKAEQILLKKLAKFEESENYLNHKISLTTLAKQLETNTKYLSEVINKNKGKNFNSYINDLRINYILIKLKTEQKYRNYKVTSLAEECGYASHSTFVAAFRSVTGLSPASFINFLKREKNL